MIQNCPGCSRCLPGKVPAAGGHLLAPGAVADYGSDAREIIVPEFTCLRVAKKFRHLFFRGSSGCACGMIAEA